MALAHYEPLAAGQLQREINRLFNHLDGSEASSGSTAGWTPSADIQEYGDRFELYIDLPGVDVKDVELTLDNGILSISGERKGHVVQQDEKTVLRRQERGVGWFYRRFMLPDTVDAESVNATTQQGVLSIVIEKQAKAQPRRIEISTAA